MKKVFMVLFLLFSISIQADDTSEMILREIKELRIGMNKRFEQVDKRFEQVDKRFEQVDKRFEQVNKQFEQVDKRLDFMQDILYMLMGLIFASPFIAIYLRDKREAEDRKNFEHLNGILFVLREMSQDDEKMKKALKSANLF